MNAQQDLHWKLEVERHKNAALSFELQRRAHESKDLQRQLNEAKTQVETLSAPQSVLAPAVSVPVLMQTQTIRTLQHVLPQGGSMRVPVSTSPLRQTRSMLALGSVQIPIATTESAPVSPNTPHQAAWQSGAAAESAPVSPISPRQNAWHRTGTTQIRKTSSQRRIVGVVSSRPSLTSVKSAQLLPPRHADSQMPARTTSMSSLHAPPTVSSALVPVSTLEPPVPMFPGSAADKAIADLREELTEWVNAVR
jgi:hypothetical protein